MSDPHDPDRPGGGTEPDSEESGKGTRAGGFQPADILAGWSRAFMVVAARFMRPPLVLIGRAPELPDQGEIGRRARGFPVVGLAIGAGAAVALGLADWLGLPPVLSAVIAVGMLAFGGGAIFESGLARFADDWIVAGDRTEPTETRDSGGLGAYGILTLVISFALRVGALAWVSSTGAAMAAVIAAAAASRAAVPVLLYHLPPARLTGLAARVGRPAFDETVIAATFGVAVALLFLGPLTGIIALIVGALGAAKIWWLTRGAAGGVTGGVLGAAQQAAEIGILLAVVALH